MKVMKFNPSHVMQEDTLPKA